MKSTILIRVPEEVRDKIRELKIHPRETDGDVLMRLLNITNNKNGR